MTPETIELLAEIQRCIDAGEIPPEAIPSPPQKRRLAPRKPKRQIRVAGRAIEIKPPLRKPTHHNMEIGRRYVELTESGKKLDHAIAVIQRSSRSRKEEPLGDSAIYKYQALYRLECQKRDSNANYKRKTGRYLDVAERLRDMLLVMDSLGIQVDPDTITLKQDDKGVHYFMFMANVSCDLGDRMWMKFWPDVK